MNNCSRDAKLRKEKRDTKQPSRISRQLKTWRQAEILSLCPPNFTQIKFSKEKKSDNNANANKNDN